MSLCAQCGYPMIGPGELCAHHNASDGVNWARDNRIMCDFVHRGLVTTVECAPADGAIELLLDTLEATLRGYSGERARQ